MVTIRIPAPSSLLAANLLGALGLILAVVAVGGLAGFWWALLTGGLALVLLSVISLTYAGAGAGEGEAARPAAAVAQVPRSA